MVKLDIPLLIYKRYTFIEILIYTTKQIFSILTRKPSFSSSIVYTSQRFYFDLPFDTLPPWCRQQREVFSRTLFYP